MKPLADFLPEVMPSVAGCPVPLIINAVRNAAIEFLKDTGLSEQAVSIPLTAGLASYVIPVAAGTVAQSFVRGVVDGAYSVTATNPVSLHDNNADWRNEAGNVPNRAFIEGGLLTVTPIPSAEGATLSAVFTTAPARAAIEVDDFLLEDWIEGIASGALSRLMALPGYPWANPELVAYHKGKFETAKSEARVFKMKGGTDSSIAVTPRRFG